MLRDQLKGNSKELDTIMRNAQRLQRLSENILSASKIDSNTIRYVMEDFDLNHLVAQVLRDLEYAVKAREIRMIFIPDSEELVVNGDKDKIGQVIGNLLENALKFADSRIVVSTYLSGEDAVLSVSDDGPGIDPQIYPVLFSKFATKSVKGTGLGLYICKKIAEAHGGTMKTSEFVAPGVGGAVFTFTFPRLRSNDSSQKE
jgi:signal transduction histidine kinase